MGLMKNGGEMMVVHKQVVSCDKDQSRGDDLKKKVLNCDVCNKEVRLKSSYWA